MKRRWSIAFWVFGIIISVVTLRVEGSKVFAAGVSEGDVNIVSEIMDEESIEVQLSSVIPEDDSVVEYDGISYTYSSESNTYSVSGCKTDTVNAVILAEIEGVAVVNIEFEAFDNCVNLKSVSVPESIEGGLHDSRKENSCRFLNCNNLLRIDIQEGNNVYCSIDGVVFSKDKATLYKCPKGKKLYEIPEGVEVIAEQAFSNCINLTNISIPSTVESIEFWTFSGCISMESITLPESVITIERRAFEGCTALKKINVPGGVTTLSEDVFLDCTSLNDVILENGIEILYLDAFRNCKSLKQINIPKSVLSLNISIHNLGMDALESINVDSENLAYKSVEGVLYEGDMTKLIKYPSAKKVSVFQVPEGVKEISADAFANSTLLTEIKLPDSLTDIGDCAFAGCSELVRVNLPDNLVSIGDVAFYGTKISALKIPQYVSEINVSSKSGDVFPFRGAEYLCNIEVVENNEYFTDYNGCLYTKDMTTLIACPQGKTDVNIYKGTQIIGGAAFKECVQLQNVYIPDTITTIYSDIASNCPDVIIECTLNSFAQEYAIENGISYVVRIPATSVKLNVTSKMMKPNDEFQLTATIEPKDFTEKVLWTSSNENVLTVTENGYVRAIASGTAQVIVMVGEQEAVCTISVEEKKPEKVTLNQISATIKKGKTLTLKADISPSDTANKNISWESSDTNVATVSSSGKVTAKAHGTALITVTSNVDCNVKATCKITVPYNITYKLNKGTNNAKNPSAYYNEKVSLKNPTRKGYIFKGWYTDKKYKNKITTIGKDKKENYTLYAKWQKVTVGKTTLASAKNDKSRKIIVKYSKIPEAKGYEVSYSTQKNFKRSVNIKSTKNTSYTIKNLKKGKTYYVRVRAYKMDSTGKKVYGKYSSVKKVKVSK